VVAGHDEIVMENFFFLLRKRFWNTDLLLDWMPTASAKSFWTFVKIVVGISTT